MAHINVKPAERSRVYETEAQAINHLFVYPALKWDFDGKAFGHTIAERRVIQAAIKSKDSTAFRAFKRRGYWRIELAK